MREWLARLVDWFRRDKLDAELTEELTFHQRRLEQEAGASGIDPAAAARLARRRLGNLTRVKEDARDRWSWPWLDQLQQDVRYALRGIRRSPGFAITVIATLGLGIGANAAMFAVIDRLMFRPYPFLRDPDQVHRIYLQSQDRDRTIISSDGYEYTRYLDLKKWTTSFSQYAAFSHRPLAVGVGDRARERPVGAVSSSYFDFFDIRPALGRFFLATEDSTPRGAAVAVLSYAFWQSEYGGRDVLGQTIHIRAITCEIVGVAPEGFIGVASGEPPAVYIPITTYAGSESHREEGADNYYTRYNWGWMAGMVRRKPGVSVAEASADLSNAHVRSWNAEKDLEPQVPSAAIGKPRAIAGPLKAAAGPDAGLESRTLLWVTGVAAIVLLIACANVANLMFARVLKRRRELAVRLALGVSRRRLLAQCLTESVLLAVLGGVVGLVVAQWGGVVLQRMFAKDAGSFLVATDWRTLGVAALFALMAGVLTGVGPAVVAGHGDLAGSLKAGAREGTFHRSRTRTILLVVQGALSVILLVGAGLFVRSLDHVRSLRLGYHPEPVLMANRNLRGLSLSDSEQVALGRRLLATAQAIPGVERAAWVSSIPFWSTSSTSLKVEGVDSVRKLGRFTYQTATSDYFSVMGTAILRGRPFTAADRAGAPRVAVVSEAMAAILWPGKDAIGQCMRVGSDTVPCTTIVGIAEDAAQNSLTNDKRFRYYLPIDQYEPAGGFALLLKMRGDANAQKEPVRKALQRVMPGDGYVTVEGLAGVVDNQRRAWQIGATMFVAFGALALVVAAIGLYGVITYNVAQRMHELGVRTALGARSADLIRLVVGQGIRFAAAGVAIGIGVALVGSRWIQPLLFQQSARDPLTYGLVAGALGVVAVVASAVPAVRATKADPNSALRSD